MLNVKDLSVEFPTLSGVVHAGADVSIDLAPGRRVGFVGESGSGKTTTALAIMRMIKRPGRIAKGQILLGDTDLLSLGAEEMRQSRLKRVSYIPQGAMNSLNTVMRIENQIRDGITDHEGKRPRAELKRRSKEALEGVGLPAEVGRMYPHELSGGMKQRACIAIGTALSPELIIADEPTSALDVIIQRQLISSVPTIGGTSFLSVDKHPAPSGYSADTAPLLEFRGVSKVNGGGLLKGPGNTVLAPMSFRLDGDTPMIVSVVGQSGSGKSTMGGLMLGFTQPTTGQVLFEGQDMARLRGKAGHALRRNVQAVFKGPHGSFNPFYRVDRALSLPLKRFGITRDPAEIKRRMTQACEAVGLNPHLIPGRFAHELPGSQRQRLMVARALMLSPKLLIADEPVSMVDASLQASILKNLHDLKDRFGFSIVHITRDLATAYHVSDFVIVLHAGHVAEAGPPAQVIGDPQHPHTRLMIDSIPWPDVDRSWGTQYTSREDMKAQLSKVRSVPVQTRGAVPGFALTAA
ncbi:ABC transporter ATP-binding protein [Fluviibacterium sp. DFM31]|uniref:ABC transporter ATP-binding protein n=1 Tax=Meridianimarinicoccus marinus TaxID=3231483 RepID=A0ABV3LB77_9RHOB